MRLRRVIWRASFDYLGVNTPPHRAGRSAPVGNNKYTGASTGERSWQVGRYPPTRRVWEIMPSSRESFFTGRILLSRKVLADLAVRDLAAFGTLVAKPE